MIGGKRAEMGLTCGRRWSRIQNMRTAFICITTFGLFAGLLCIAVVASDLGENAGWPVFILGAVGWVIVCVSGYLLLRIKEELQALNVHAARKPAMIDEPHAGPTTPER